MHVGIFRPPSEPLPVEPEYHSSGAKECSKCHVGHQGWYEPSRLAPGRNEPAKAITPQVLGDRDDDEETASNRLVGVDGISRRYRRESGGLDSCAGITNNHYQLREAARQYCSKN